MIPHAIKVFSESDIPSLQHLTVSGQHETEKSYFEKSWSDQENGGRCVFICLDEAAKIIGYVHYNRFPKYAPFRSIGIPEIQDLYVSPDYRRSGIGSALIAACEKQAIKDGHQEIGIGVSVTYEFAAAQRLYAKLGYIPDGGGVVFEREYVQPGQLKPIDDRLCMMLLKTLS